MYFTQKHEDAIVQYVKTNSKQEKNYLYRDLIGPVFQEMIEKIIYTYRFTTLPNIENLKYECEIHLLTILSKFDQSKGSKAFTYFTVVAKNFFIHQVKKKSKQIKEEICIEEVINEKDVKRLSYENDFHEVNERENFIEYLKKEMELWQFCSLKEHERRILEAFKILLKYDEDVIIYNKKAIYIHLREITKLNSKQILLGIKKFKPLFYEFRQKWKNEYLY